MSVEPQDREKLPFLFLLRLVMGHASYAAGTPGGLFAPLLVLGAQSGLLFGAACLFVFPGLGIPVQTFAVVGMAGWQMRGLAGNSEAFATNIVPSLDLEKRITYSLAAIRRGELNHIVSDELAEMLSILWYRAVYCRDPVRTT